MSTRVSDMLGESELRNIVSAPVIYLMIVPLLIFDIFVSIYQFVCFPLYRIPKVKRGYLVVIDRQQLEYMNGVEKLNCSYARFAAFGQGEEYPERQRAMREALAESDESEERGQDT